MEIKEIALSELIHYENNPRKNDHAVDVVAKSIKEFGFKVPIVIDGENVIIAGHTRAKAAEQLGLKKVPCIIADDLTPEQVRAFRIADNKTHEFAEWDMDLLREELDGINLFTGFDEDELREILDSVKFSEVEEDDFDPTPPEEPKSKLGDIYQLGRHRLMCGDSCSDRDASRLMSGVMADLFVTDPPYNMSYEGGGGTSKKQREKNKILNDSMPDDKFREFITCAMRVMGNNLNDGGSFYIFYKELGQGVFLSAISDAKLTFRQMLVWVKNQIVLGGADYQNIYEPFLYGCKGSKRYIWNGKRKQRSVIESIDLMHEEELRDVIREITEEDPTDVVRVNKRLVNDLHPTMKPVRLLSKLIKNSSHEGCVVGDYFGGSGSTLIACEQLNRTCYMMELDPKYIDVIINRWEQFTGDKAVLLDE